MSRIARTYFERAVDVCKAVGIAMNYVLYRQILVSVKKANKAPGRAGRHPAHLDDNAPCRFPKTMIIEALKHATGFNGEHETCIGPEAQMFDRARNAIGPTPQVGAVDLDGLFRRGISVDHGEPTRDRAAVGFRVEAQLLARQPVHRRHSLDVVHNGVRLGLFVEAAITPVLADVINLTLGGKIVMLDHRS